MELLTATDHKLTLILKMQVIKGNGIRCREALVTSDVAPTAALPYSVVKTTLLEIGLTPGRGRPAGMPVSTGPASLQPLNWRRWRR